MIRARWRTHLRNADSESKVLEIVRVYLDEWRAAGDALPQAVWPPRISSTHDVMTWTFRLGELHTEFVGGASPMPPGLQDCLLFATHASVRLGELTSPAPHHPKAR